MATIARRATAMAHDVEHIRAQLMHFASTVSLEVCCSADCDALSSETDGCILLTKQITHGLLAVEPQRGCLVRSVLPLSAMFSSHLYLRNA